MNFRYRILGVLGIILLLYFKTFMWLLDSWLYDPFYSHGFIIPVISLFIIWSKRKELKSIQQKKDPMDVYVFAFGLTLYAAGTFWKFLFLLGISLIPVLAGLILHFYGREFMRKLLFPIGFLLFMIPLPGLDMLGIHLQHFTANNAAWISQSIGIEVYKDGLEMYVLDCPILIGLPCSGLRSIISLLIVAAVFAYIIKGSISKKAVILFMTVPIAVASNTIRVTSALLIAGFIGCDAATTFFHNFSGILVFVIALIMLIIFAKILKCDIL